MEYNPTEKQKAITVAFNAFKDVSMSCKPGEVTEAFTAALATYRATCAALEAKFPDNDGL